MGKSAPSPPPAPDYVGAANAQGAANLTSAQQGAILSNPNINGPLGSQSVAYNSISGPDGQSFLQPSITQNLTPDALATLEAQQRTQRGLADLGNQALGTASGIIGHPFSPNLPGIQTSIGGYGQANGNLDTSGIAKMPVNAGTTAQQAILSRLQPQIQQRNDALTQQLANQGIAPGSEAYSRALTQQGYTNNDLLTQAAAQGIGIDMNANQQGFNQALQGAGLYNQAVGQNYNQTLGSAQFGNQAENQSLQQQLGLYNQPLNQISALMGGSQIQLPQFQGYSGQNVQPAPIANATAQAGQYAQNLYGQQVAQYNAQQQGMAGLFGSALQAAPFFLA